MARVGFIGVGNMGSLMARNLIRAGHSLKVFDVSEEAVNFAIQSGAKAAGSVKEAASGVDFVVTMLHIVHCGDAGFGQVTKICNNMVAGITALAVAEAFVMGEKLGVARQTLYDVLSTSSAGSFILSRNCPVAGPVPTSASSNGYKPGFRAKLMLKDLRLSQAAAQVAGTATPLGAAATAAYALHVANGFGDLDSSSIIKLINPDVELSTSGTP